MFNSAVLHKLEYFSKENLKESFRAKVMKKLRKFQYERNFIIQKRITELLCTSLPTWWKNIQ